MSNLRDKRRRREPPPPEEPTDADAQEEEDKLERDRARRVILRAIKRQGWYWPGEDD